jgi:hypothetical protein
MLQNNFSIVCIYKLLVNVYEPKGICSLDLHG